MQYGSMYPPPVRCNPGLPVLNEGGGYSDVKSDAELYAALLDNNLATRARAHADLQTARRTRINCVPVMMALLLPWALFLGIFALNSFYFHYMAPMTTSLLTGSILLAALFYTRHVSKDTQTSAANKFFPTYLGVSMCMAIAFGWFLGDLNFWSYMQPTFQEEHLATYSNVDPSSQTMWSQEVVPTRGRRFQDAGKVYFRHETVVDLTRAMSFKMGELYCVAPIVNPSCQKNCGNDFWAVGVNCCNEDGSNFQCGQVHNPKAHSGLRLLAESKRAMFRLAVMQAQADPSGKMAPSTHPLFFIFLQDPVAEIMRWRKQGYRHFVLVMFGSFFMNAMLLGATLKSASLDYMPRPKQPAL